MRHRVSSFGLGLAGSVVLAACGSSSSGSTTAPAASAPASRSASVQVKTAPDAALGGTILVDSHGMTLYRLTGEEAGKFICNGSCLKAWHPLIASASASPSGTVGSLGTVTRADGTVQVAFKGQPLYTFVKDTSPGQATGQGIKDVGTWTAVLATAQKASPPAGSPTTTTKPAPSSSGSGGRSGY